MTIVEPCDSPPGELGPSRPATIHDLPNRRQGHLRIDSDGDTWLFIDTGEEVIRFGPMSGPSIELGPEQLRVWGDYCHRMADKLEGRQKERVTR